MVLTFRIVVLSFVYWKNLDYQNSFSVWSKHRGIIHLLIFIQRITLRTTNINWLNWKLNACWNSSLLCTIIWFIYMYIPCEDKFSCFSSYQPIHRLLLSVSVCFRQNFVQPVLVPRSILPSSFRYRQTCDKIFTNVFLS